MNPTGPQRDDVAAPDPTAVHHIRRVVVRRPGGAEPDDQRGRPPSDRDEVWGEGDTSNDERLRRDVPPHHGD